MINGKIKGRQKVCKSTSLERLWRHQIKKIFRVTGPSWGEFTGDRWIPPTKATDAELWYFLWPAPGQTIWSNNRYTGDFRRHRVHYDVTVMKLLAQFWSRTKWRINKIKAIGGNLKFDHRLFLHFVHFVLYPPKLPKGSWNDFSILSNDKYFKNGSSLCQLKYPIYVQDHGTLKLIYIFIKHFVLIQETGVTNLPSLTHLIFTSKKIFDTKLVMIFKDNVLFYKLLTVYTYMLHAV